MIKRLILILLLVFFCSTSYATTYWVHTDGTETNLTLCDGSNPPATSAGHCTLAAVNTGVSTGTHTIYLRGGTYSGATELIYPTNSGTSWGSFLSYETYELDPTVIF